jgi:restriction system protein
VARRRRRAAARGAIGWGVAAAVAVGFLAVSALVQAAERHPVADVVVGVVLVFALGCGIVGWTMARQRRTREERRLAEIRWAQSREIARYHEMSAKEFEDALAYLCQRDGCTNVRVVGGAGDLGADVVGYAPDGRKVVLQAKRYRSSNAVTGPDLQKFGGTCFTVHQAHVAAVVTTSRFTKQASQYASHMNIRLVDEPSLAAWASQTGPPPWT